jgi:hypothetical protein
MGASSFRTENSKLSNRAEAISGKKGFFAGGRERIETITARRTTGCRVYFLQGKSVKKKIQDFNRVFCFE